MNSRNLFEYIQNAFLFLLDCDFTDEISDLFGNCLGQYFILRSFTFRKKDFIHFHVINCKNCSCEDIQRNIQTAIQNDFFTEIYEDNTDVCLGIAFFTIKKEIPLDINSYQIMLFDFLLPSCFFIHNLFIDKNRNLYFIYGNKITGLLSEKKYKRALAIFWGDGIGDLFIVYNILLRKIKEAFYQKRPVYIFIYDRSKHSSITKLIKGLFLYYPLKIIPVQSLFLADFLFEKLIKTGLFHQCVNLISTTKNFRLEQGIHLQDYYSRVLDIEMKKYFHNWNHLFKRQLTANQVEKVYIKLDGYKPNIGFQFWTGDFHLPPVKCWTPDEVELFCELCKDKFNLINLSPYPTERYRLKHLVHAEELSVLEVLFLLSKVDMVVGIDSFSGHAAALLGKPSVTVWCNNALSESGSFEKSRLGARPVRMNISVIPQKSASVSAAVIFDIATRINNGNIKIRNETITYRDSLHGEGILYDV